MFEIKAKELPELDDEFAQDVSEFDTLAEYKESLKKNLQEQKENEAKRTKEDGQALKARYGRILFRDGCLLRGGAAGRPLLDGGGGNHRDAGGVHAVCDEPEPPGQAAPALYPVHVQHAGGYLSGGKPIARGAHPAG